MKKLTCLLLCVFLVGITSSAKEEVETDYVNIKNAVLMYVSNGMYEKAVECIDLYGYTVQENAGFYADLQNDRRAISYIIKQEPFVQTKQMVQTLVLNKKYGLCLTYLSEQIPLYADCPDYQADLQKDVDAVSVVFYQLEQENVLKTAAEYAQSGRWTELGGYLTERISAFQNPYGEVFLPPLQQELERVQERLVRAKFAGTFAGDGAELIASTDDVGTVIETLKIQKDGVQIVLADENTRGFIYTEPDRNLTACGAYVDNFKNAGYVFAYMENGAVHLTVTSDGYGGITAAGTYILHSKN